MIVAHAETREELTCNAFKHFDWFFFFHNLIVWCNCKSIRNCRCDGWRWKKWLVEFIKYFWVFKGILRSFCLDLFKGSFLPWLIVKKTFDILQKLLISRPNQLQTPSPTFLGITTPSYNYLIQYKSRIASWSASFQSQFFFYLITVVFLIHCSQFNSQDECVNARYSKRTKKTKENCNCQLIDKTKWKFLKSEKSLK